MKNRGPSVLVLAGGGSGGHVLAGVALAEKWTINGDKAVFIGARGGMEERLVPRFGFGLKLLRIGSLNRVSFGRKILTLIQLPIALLQSVWWLRRFQPSAVVGVGGYASGPVLLMAAIMKKCGLLNRNLKVAILEQNSVPGMTNRILSHFVQRIYIAFRQSEQEFSKISASTFQRVRLFGNPIRSQLAPIELPENFERKIRDKHSFTLFVFGGSQGAVGMNTLVIEGLSELVKKIPNLSVIHQTGERDFVRVKSAYEDLAHDKSLSGTYQVEKFIYTMQACYEKADLIICRAGSSTLFEIAIVGKPAVFVPLPTSADNHQEKNANEFAEKNAGWVVPQANAQGRSNSDQLVRLICHLYEHPEELKNAAVCVRKFARPQAAQEIVNDLKGGKFHSTKINPAYDASTN